MVPECSYDLPHKIIVQNVLKRPHQTLDLGMFEDCSVMELRLVHKAVEHPSLTSLVYGTS